jgi:hypothetical protein
VTTCAYVATTVLLLTDYTLACVPSPKALAAGDRQAGIFTD